MKQLIFTTDMSDGSKEFLAYAVNFAAVIDAGITIVYAYHPDPITIDGMLLSDGNLQTVAEKSFNEYVDELIKGFESFEVPIQRKFLIGFASDAILEYADESRAYMILMGTTGPGNLKKWFGSVSTDVMKKSEIPVLLIPPHYEFSLVKRIIYADDFTNNHDKGLDYLEQLLSEFLADVYCVHVVEEDDEEDDWLDLSSLENRFAGVKLMHIKIDDDSIIEGLLDEIEDLNADLVIMPSYKHGFVYDLFHKSVTRQVAIESKKPILIVH